MGSWLYDDLTPGGPFHYGSPAYNKINKLDENDVGILSYFLKTRGESNNDIFLKHSPVMIDKFYRAPLEAFKEVAQRVDAATSAIHRARVQYFDMQGDVLHEREVEYRTAMEEVNSEFTAKFMALSAALNELGFVKQRGKPKADTIDPLSYTEDYVAKNMEIISARICDSIWKQRQAPQLKSKEIVRQ